MRSSTRLLSARTASIQRHGARSTLITSQLPVAHWHESIGDPTLADAILDRLVHQAHSLDLAGESLRKKGRPE